MRKPGPESFTPGEKKNTVPILKKVEMASGPAWRGKEYLVPITVLTLDRPSSTDYSIPAASI